MTDEQRQHLDAAVIAHLDAGVLDAVQAGTAEAHLGTCPACSQVRADLAELPALLASVPAPAIPAEVAARLDAALERAAQQRDREQRTATVTALSSRRRRFLLPLAAAAAVAAAVGFLIPELNLEPNSAEDAATAGDAPTFVEGGAAEGTDDSAGGLADLSSESFGGDVATELYQKPAAENESALTSARDERQTAFLDRSGCAPSPTPTVARLRSVLLDGQRATLLTYGPLGRRVAVAYTCADGRPVVQARAVLDLR